MSFFCVTKTCEVCGVESHGVKCVDCLEADLARHREALLYAYKSYVGVSLGDKVDPERILSGIVNFLHPLLPEEDIQQFDERQRVKKLQT